MKITANGISINYTLDGPVGGPVVTLSHSLATTLAMWEPQLKALTARWRGLNYDTRGHGGPDAPRGASTHEHVAGVPHVLLAAPRTPRAHRGVVSMGGAIGPSLALKVAGRW